MQVVHGAKCHRDPAPEQDDDLCARHNKEKLAAIDTKLDLLNQLVAGL